MKAAVFGSPYAHLLSKHSAGEPELAIYAGDLGSRRGDFRKVDMSKFNATPVTNPDTGEVSDLLITQDGAYAVYQEHIRALNASDWLGLMAQYPDDAEIHMSNGAVAKGRVAIGEMFAEAVRPPAEGGIAGLVFRGESELEVGGTLTVQWEADADWLTAPYKGSDAYVSDGQFMAAMVSTFDGDGLKMKVSLP